MNDLTISCFKQFHSCSQFQVVNNFMVVNEFHSVILQEISLYFILHVDQIMITNYYTVANNFWDFNFFESFYPMGSPENMRPSDVVYLLITTLNKRVTDFKKTDYS